MAGLWGLCWRDHDGKFHIYDRHEPTAQVRELLEVLGGLPWLDLPGPNGADFPGLVTLAPTPNKPLGRAARKRPVRTAAAPPRMFVWRTHCPWVNFWPSVTVIT